MEYSNLYTQFENVNMHKFDLLHFLYALGVQSANAIYLFDEEII